MSEIQQQPPSGFKDLLNSMMKRRWYITALVLGSFIIIIGGIFGAIMTGVLAAPSLGGSGIWDYVANGVAPDYDMLGQVKIQAIAVGTTVIWSGIVAFISYKLVDLTIGLRVPEEDERIGLDVTSHGERAYND